MTIPAVICKTVGMQNNSPWSCSMCPIPQQLRLVGVRTSIYFLIFPGHPKYWTPLQIPPWEALAISCYRKSNVNSSSRKSCKLHLCMCVLFCF